MPTLTLSRLVAGRDLAAAAVARLGPIESAPVVVDARPLVSGTASFAGQLVRSILVDGHAARLTLVGGPADFAADVKSAGGDLGVEAKLAFAIDDGELHPAS